MADDPCLVYLSSTGLLARTTAADPPGSGGARARHDAVVSVVRSTARADLGVVTSRGRVVRFGALDLPTLPATANDPHLQGGAPLSEFAALAPGERALALTALRGDGPGLALGTRLGVVKRVNPEVPGNKDDWEVIRLADGDELVGATELQSAEEELCFVSSDAQLLHFGADQVRPQGRAGGGMAGIRLARGRSVVWFGAVDPQDAVVVTVAGSGGALPGVEAGTVKVTPFGEYPPKGRGTGGVRCHRFLRGEQTLLLAWAGAAPARAASASGSPVDLPGPIGRRDGSGTPAGQVIAAVAAPVRSRVLGWPGVAG